MDRLSFFSGIHDFVAVDSDSITTGCHEVDVILAMLKTEDMTEFMGRHTRHRIFSASFDLGEFRIFTNNHRFPVKKSVGAHLTDKTD